MGGITGLLVPLLMGVDSCGPAGGASPVGGGGGSNVEHPRDTADTADTGENGGTPGTLTDCDPEYVAVWVECRGGSSWIAHAEMNVAVQWIEVSFAGTSKGDIISELPQEPGVFEGELRLADAPCAKPNAFDFMAMGVMFNTYECSYDYTP
jgi:hypothetical protein